MTSIYPYLHESEHHHPQLRLLTRCEIPPEDQSQPCICTLTIHLDGIEQTPPLTLSAHEQSEIDTMILGPSITSPGLYQITLICPQSPDLDAKISYPVGQRILTTPGHTMPPRGVRHAS